MNDLLEADPKEITKNHGLAFYLACTFLKGTSFDDVRMITSFYRFLREVADYPNRKKAREILGSLEAELDFPRTTFMVRFCDTLERLGIEKLYAKELISSARFDVRGSRVAHHNQLVIYCYKNLGAMGLLLAPALGAKRAEAGPFAVDFGIGANLTRICARVLKDAKAGRVWIPKRDLDQLKLLDSDLAREGDTPLELKELIEKYLALADSYLESSMGGLVYLPLRARLMVLIGLRSCQELASKIRRHDIDVLEGDFKLSVFNKISIGARLAVDLLGPRFWVQGKRRAYLHPSLAGLPGVREVE